MANFDMKKLLPHIVAVVVFLLLTVAFFSPILKGYTLNQGDIRNWQGVAKEIVDQRESTGEQALWTNSLFGGMPAYLITIKYSGNLLKHFHQVFSAGIPQPMGFLLICMLGFYFLMLVLRINPWIGLIGAVAFAFSTYFVIIIEAGHNTKLQAIAYMAPLLGSLILTFRGKYLLGGALTGVFLALEISCNHLQITYYLFLLILVYGVIELVNAVMKKQFSQFAKAAMVAVMAGAIGVGANVNRLWGLIEYSEYSTRGQSELTSNMEDKTSGLDKSYATAWSYGKDETWTLLIPNYKGGGSGAIMTDNEDALDAVTNPQMKQLVAQLSPYFGDQPFTSGPVYIGAILCFLFVLGLLITDGPLKWVMIVGTILSIALSWGKNYVSWTILLPLIICPIVRFLVKEEIRKYVDIVFAILIVLTASMEIGPSLTDFFLEKVPGYNKFRTVSMTLVLAELTIPVLACMALDQIVKKFNKEHLKKLYVGFGIAGGLCLLLYLMGQSYSGAGDVQLQQQLVQAGIQQAMIPEVMTQLGLARESIFESDALRSFGFILLAFVTLFFFARKTYGKEVLLVLLGIFILADMWTVNKRYIDTDTTKQYSQWVKKRDKKVAYQPDGADQAILQDTDPNFRVYNLTMRLDQDSRTSYFHKSLGGYHGAKMKRYQELIDFHLSKGNPGVINMLNAKYFIDQVPDPQDPSGQKRIRQARSNPGALGNVWFVSEAKMVANADEEIAALEGLDPSKTAVVDQRYADQVTGTSFNPQGSITQTSYKPGEWIYQSDTKAEGLAVFSEIYYPKGMKVTIDDQEAQHFRTNYVLRGMVVPAGKHTIKFSFEPNSYYVGEKVSLACSGLLLLALAFAGFRAFKGSSDPTTEPEPEEEVPSEEE